MVNIPTSVSQLVEQIVRIIFLLGGSLSVVMSFRWKAETAISLCCICSIYWCNWWIIVYFIIGKSINRSLNQLRNKVVRTVEQLNLKDIYKEVINIRFRLYLLGLQIHYSN